MIFNHVTAEEQLLNLNIPNNAEDKLYIKSMISNPNELQKFKMFLGSPNGERIIKGYIYFYVNTEMYKSYFIGMRVDLDFRLRNYANLLISSYINLCNDSHIYDLTTHQKQRKPEVIHILKKFGYEMTGEVDDEMEINIIDRGNRQKNVLYIPNKALRRSLEFSKLARENNYIFIDSLDGETILDTVYFNQPYRLADRTKCLRKQRQIIERQF